MAIDPVNGYGQITQSNAKEIYTAYRKGEVSLTAAQRNYAENFLSDEDLDEIDYNVDVAKNDGKGSIDTDKAESHGGQGANVALSAAPAALQGLLLIFPWTDGFTQTKTATWLAGGLAAASLGSAVLFDNAYSDRSKTEENEGEVNSELQDNTAVLEETMESMNEDMELYQAQSEEYTLAVNGNISDISSLEMQLSDAMAAGDKEGAKRLREQIAQLKKQDFSGEQEGLDEIRDQLNEYQYGNEMAQGVSQAGNTVAEFLKEGTALGAVATPLGVFYTVIATLTSVAASASTPKLAPFFPDAAPCFAAKAVMWAVAAMFGGAAALFGTKAAKEFECGSSGRDMQRNVNALNEMIEQQSGYMETTTESFTDADDASAESQDKAQEAAAKLQQDKAERKQNQNNKPVVAEQSKPAATGSSQQNA